MGTVAGNWAQWTGVVGALVALMSLMWNIVQSRRVSKLNHRLLELEEGREADRKDSEVRAQLRAKVVVKRVPGEPGMGAVPPTLGRTFEYLVVENIRDATACEIQVWLDGDSIDKVDYVRANSELRTLGGHSEFRFMLRSTTRYMQKPPQHIRIEWSDESGRPGFYESSLAV